MKVDLIPCPECGSGAELKQSFYFGMDQSYSYVHCTNPDCDLFCHNPHFTGYSAEENDEHAAASWNERYADTMLQKTEEFVRVHRNEEHHTFFENLMTSFSWDKVLPFHQPHSHR